MRKCVVIVFALIVSCALSFYFLRPDPLTGSTSPTASAVQTKQHSSQKLFPDFDASHVVSVSITTPQSSFDLRRENGRPVSINGQRGDAYVFSTLLGQIASLSYVPMEAFIVPGQPLLTLNVRLSNEEYSAVFYDDGSSGEYARIAFMQNNTPAYGVTDRWRVGTLMLTCEGTRVQDAHGRETPVE